MLPDALIERVLDDEGLTSELDEAEASALINSLVARVRVVAAKTDDPTTAQADIERLCRRARQIAATVAAFRDHGEREARRIAQQEGLSWPGKVSGSIELLQALLID